jgi:hypothetical protein
MSNVGSNDREINAVFDVYETGGLGDCLFYSLGYAIHDSVLSPDEVFQMRQEICQVNNVSINGVPVNAFIGTAAHEANMCTAGVYGTETEILKAAKIFNRPIIVYEEHRNVGLAEAMIPEIARLQQIRAGAYCPEMQRYFTAPHFANVLNRMYTFYLPNDTNANDTNASEPLLILYVGNMHYRVLRPKPFVPAAAKPAAAKPAAAASNTEAQERKANKLFQLLQFRLSGDSVDFVIELAKHSMLPIVVDAVVKYWREHSMSTASASSVANLGVLSPQPASKNKEEQEQHKAERLFQLLQSGLSDDSVDFVIELAKHSMLPIVVDAVVKYWREHSMSPAAAKPAAAKPAAAKPAAAKPAAAKPAAAKPAAAQPAAAVSNKEAQERKANKLFQLLQFRLSDDSVHFVIELAKHSMLPIVVDAVVNYWNKTMSPAAPAPAAAASNKEAQEQHKANRLFQLLQSGLSDDSVDFVIELAKHSMLPIVVDAVVNYWNEIK